VGVADSATSLILGPVESANFTAGPLPAISGSSLTGVDKYLSSAVADTGNVGVGEDTLFTFNNAAGKLATNGEALRIVAWGKTANNANTKDIQIRIDDTATDTSILNASLTVSQVGHWQAGAVVIRATSTTARSMAQVIDSTANGDLTKSVGNIGKDFSCIWANAVEVRITGEATSDNDITIEGALVGLTSV